MSLLCFDAGGAGKSKETPSETGGVLIFLGTCCGLCRRQRKSDPPERGFFGFQAAARVSHVAIIAARRGQVNELNAAIHAAETSPA
jgi:hypothetical protein